MNSPLETAELQAFARTVEARSLSLAARQLALPRQTLGRRLSRLEERLGVRLLRRTTRSIALTDEGATLYEHACAVLEAARAAEESVKRRDDVVRGVLRVSLPPVYDEGLLAALSSFARRYPHVQLHVVFTSRQSDLLHEVDVALRSGTPLKAGLIARTVQRYEMLAVASPAYVAAHGLPRAPSELTRHACLVFSADGVAPQTQWPLRGGRSVRVEAALTSNSLVFLREAARRGRGIALLPSTLAHDDVRTGQLQRVLSDQINARGQLAAVYADRKLIAPSVRAFVDAICAWARASRADAGP
jgi:DNA-binding transcriptional LysR family regulator